MSLSTGKSSSAIERMSLPLWTCILILVGNPKKCARICKIWKQACQSPQFYNEVLRFWQRQPTVCRILSRITTTEKPKGKEESEEPAQKKPQSRDLMIRSCEYILERIHAPHIQDSCALTLQACAPLDLQAKLEIIEATNLVGIFKRIQLAISENETLQIAEDLPVTEKAALIRAWMKANQPILDQITWLNLSSLNLTSLPEEIGSLRRLQNLNLSNNYWLRELPESIGQLGALQTLFLENNQLTELPASFGQLGALEWLDLSKNQLKELPASIGQLGALEWLYLNNNPLVKLPIQLEESVRDGLEITY